MGAARDFIDRLLGRDPATGTRAEVAAEPTSAPTEERGFAIDATANFWNVPDEEKLPELRWPASIDVYDDMRRQDAQVISVLRAVMLPILRTTWRIEKAGATDEVTAFVAQNLGLPVVGEDMPPAKRQRDRFSWPDHLRHALLSLVFGHSFFEQTYRIGPDERGVLRAWIRKLGWRPPRTISRIDVAPDGGLVAIEQGGLTGQKANRQEVDRLVAYVNEREGGNWLGQSLLRPAYKYWILKDRMLRVQAQTIDRNGMGIPVFTAPEVPTALYPEAKDHEKRVDALLAAGRKLARGLRAGREAGAAISSGSKVQLLGVEGTLPDADKPIRYYDEQIGRAVLANFLNLGGDNSTGSYALGSTFADFFVLSLQTIALSVRDTANQHIVDDLVDINFGADEPAPRIVFDEIGSQQAITADAIRALVEAKAITPDASLERFLRQVFQLPALADDAESGDPTAKARSLAEIVQKLYLGVGVVLTDEEARQVLRDGGMDLAAGIPDGLGNPPTPPTPNPSEGT